MSSKSSGIDKKTAQSINNYSKIAARYDSTFDGKFTQSFKEEIVNVIHLENAYKILDVACGNGTLLKLLSEKADIQGYGVDISEEMIKVSKSKHPEFQFCVTNSSLLPFEDSFFDAITVCAAFHHFTEPHKFMTEAKRVLKSGGNIYIADLYLPAIARQIANLFLPLFRMGDVKIYSKRELVSFYQESGFAIVALRHFGILGYILRGSK